MDTYMNAAWPPEKRASALLAELSLEEKLAQVQGIFPLGESAYRWESIRASVPNGIGHVSTLEMRCMETLEEAAEWQRTVQRIVMSNSPHHIPAIFHMEGLCGPFLQDSTSYPSGMARGAGWDPELEEEIGRDVSRQEAACGITQVLAPVLDVARDPRLGRYGESYGEDPTLVAALGTAYAKGLHSGETAGRRTEGAAKHFLGFHASQGGIHGAHSELTPRTLREVFAKPFQAAITEAGLKGIMPCYCSFNGEPVTSSRAVLRGLLRGEMGFSGVCVSDYSAVSNVFRVQHVCESLPQAGLRCLRAGLDVELPSAAAFGAELLELFRSGEADVSVLDEAVLRVLTAKFRMGLFEEPFALQGEELRRTVCGGPGRALSLRSARESIVLLKNDGALPLSPEIRRLAVIGPHAADASVFFGGYTDVSMAQAAFAAPAGAERTEQGDPVQRIPGTKVQSAEGEAFRRVLDRQQPGCPTLLDALREALPGVEIQVVRGYEAAGEATPQLEEALQAVSGADAAILTLGGRYSFGPIATMGEGVDGADINLPPCQERFLRLASQTDTPLIGVHFDGRPISSDAADESLSALLEAWAPAACGAQALADVLLGKVNPGGKLPVTVARSAGQLPIQYNHPYGSAWHQGESVGFPDYVDLPHRPRYCFGHGLSYTRFVYSGLTLSADSVQPHEGLELRVTVQNTGYRSGDEVVQLYLSDPYASMTRPVKELAGFHRVTLLPGERKTILFRVLPSQLAFLDEEMRWKIERGEVKVQVGSSSEDIRLTAGFRILADSWIDGKTRAFCAASEVLPD